MKQKGFTLIELLAVIVVLAIIAVIATPMVLNTIEDARKGSAKSSGYTYISEVETSLAKYMLKNSGVSYNAGKYDVSTLTTDLEIALKGDTPSEGNVCIGSSGTVTKASLKINGYIVSYDGKKTTTTDLETIEDISCDGTTEEETPEEANYIGLAANTYNAGDSISYAGVEWYVVQDNGDNVTLITKENIGTGWYGSNGVNSKLDWNDSLARETVTNWFNNNSELLSEQNNSGLVIDSSTGDYVRLPIANELSDKIPNNSNTTFWTMTKSGSETLIIGGADGAIGTTIGFLKENYYYNTTTVQLNVGIEENATLTALPGVSESLIITETSELVNVGGVSSGYMSKNAAEAQSRSEYQVCDYNNGVTQMTISALWTYAIGDETCTNTYQQYEATESTKSLIGYRPVITVKEK